MNEHLPPVLVAYCVYDSPFPFAISMASCTVSFCNGVGRCCVGSNVIFSVGDRRWDRRVGRCINH
jgi:hypothetical protein